MTTLETAAWLVLLFPLAGCVLTAIGYRVWPGRTAGYLGTAAIAGAFVSAIVVFLQLQDRPHEERQVVVNAWDYAVTAGVDAKLSLLVDPLSVLMILVVTGVSMLIHLYSVAYLWEDRGWTRFFS
jgi:NADH-quinone oxidoreductase subunit L